MFFRERLEDFVANKRVALVGPANYLTSFRFGGIIDEYDVVARVNRGMELTQSMGDHVGTRTDILYNCLVEHPDNGGEINVNFLRSLGYVYLDLDRFLLPLHQVNFDKLTMDVML